LLLEAARDEQHLGELVERRTTGLPLEQVIGWTEFAGVRIELDPGVFVPRHRSELLAREAARMAAAGAVVVDMCCGSGALGAAVAAAVPGVELYAVDVDPGAARCARRNLAGATVLVGDLFEPLPDALRRRVRVIVCNAPYVPTAEISQLPPEARDHEPRPALDGGADGLDVVRRVATEAPAWLAPGGCLLVEASERQAADVAAALRGHGLAPRLVRDEELEATVVVGTASR